MNAPRPFGLFQAFGVELEYMIVRRETLDVLPVADEVLKAVAGEYVSDVQVGRVVWSNELVAHVLEVKTDRPATELAGWADRFQESIGRINRILEPLDGRLLPTGSHPWMNPLTETRLWPHAYSAVYATFDRIFNCRGHGWSNLQSCHVNLPFADDREFGALHAAIRCLLPILPALAASSPLLDGQPTGFLDTRLREYRKNSARIPSVAGEVIPEPVYSMNEYRETILERIYRDLAGDDPEGILRDEFVNARGAIARFSRQTIEIRLLDVQEAPVVDLAILEGIVGCLRKVLAEVWQPLSVVKRLPTLMLASILQDTLRDAEETRIADPDYLAAFGWTGSSGCSARELWSHILAGADLPPESRNILRNLLRHGSLARRILKRLEGDYARNNLVRVYGELGDCLAAGKMFLP